MLVGRNSSNGPVFQWQENRLMSDQREFDSRQVYRLF